MIGAATCVNTVPEVENRRWRLPPAQWVVRVVLSLLCWPVEDAADAGVEQQMLERFVAPAFISATEI